MGQKWIPWKNSSSAGTHSMTPIKQETQISSASPNAKKAAMGHRLCAVVCLSTLCFMMLVTCIALGILYKRESDNTPEWKSLLFDYQNISDYYLTATKANAELSRDNENLRERNARLCEQTRLLNQSCAKLTSTNDDLTLESMQLQEQIANLTSMNLRLNRDHNLLVLHSAELEAEKSNMSQSIAYLTEVHARLEEDRRKLSETNAFLKDELFRANEKNQELLEMNTKFQGEIQNLNERIKADDFLRDHSEEASKNNTHNFRETIEELQDQKRNLSVLLEQERQTAAERESSTREEMDRMLVDMRLMNGAYHSLDQYCPAVDQTTNERICKKCEDRWTLFQTKCYHFSSRTLPWEASRAWCHTQGGDLLIINSKQEQSFIFATSQAMDQATTRVWIGLTDAEEEGEWHWVDDSPVSTDVQYWLSRPGGVTEPDDWRFENPLGEDCGHIDTSETDLNSWMDGSCNTPYSWICEKSV